MIKALVNFVLGIPQALFGGFIFAHMWHWFIVPRFGLPDLTFMQAVGVLMTIGFPLYGLYMKDVVKDIRKDKPEFSTGAISIMMTVITTCFLYPVILGSAYVWHLVIG